MLINDANVFEIPKIRPEWDSAISLNIIINPPLSFYTNSINSIELKKKLYIPPLANPLKLMRIF
jgi:hypothetical protein